MPLVGHDLISTRLTEALAALAAKSEPPTRSTAIQGPGPRLQGVGGRGPQRLEPGLQGGLGIFDALDPDR